MINSKCLLQGLGLGLGAQATVSHTLSVQLDGVLGEVETADRVTGRYEGRGKTVSRCNNNIYNYNTTYYITGWMVVW